MLVAADWNSLQFGEEYLSLQKGEWLRVLPGIVEGWAFAFPPRLSSYGWYPPTFAAEAASVGLGPIMSVAAGRVHTCALQADGQLVLQRLLQ